MRQVADTAKWEAALRRGYRQVTKLYVVEAGGSGSEQLVDAVVTGGVTLDISAEHRGRLDSLQVAGLELVPTEAEDLFAPYGNELRVCKGIRYWDGSEDLVSVGYFRTEDVTIEESGEGVSVTLNALDLSKKVADAKFEEPYAIPANTLATDAIKELVLHGDPDAEFDFVETSVELPALVAEEEGNRWALAQAIATSLGADLYYDGDRKVVLRPTATLGLDSAAVNIVDGEEGTLTTIQKSWSRTDSFNRVIVASNNAGVTGLPVRGVATDENPLSPTYYYGPFGKVPRFYSNEFITSQAQADDAAQGILSKELGTVKQLSFTAVPDPRVEPGDVVRVRRERVGVDEDNVLDSVTIPLGPEDTISCTTRTMQVAA